MVYQLLVDVRHEAANCPADDPAGKLPALLESLESLADAVSQASDGAVNIVADWYDRNDHTFHYLLEVTDLRPARAEDILKKGIGLPAVTITSRPTESGEQAIEVLREKVEAAQ